MRKLSFNFLVSLLLMYTWVYPQESWNLINPHPTSNNINDIYFLDDNYGFVVGMNGLILKTTDGMESWENIINVTEKTLTSVHFINYNKGAVVGNEGAVFITTDGGNSWVDKKGSLPQNYHSVVKYSDENTIWIGSGNTIYKTTNSGDSWTSYNQPSPFLIADIYPIDNLKCFWCGFGGIYKTENGGANWSSVSTNLYVYQFNKISFVDSQHGWIIGSNKALIKTTNGGTTWTEYSNIEQWDRESMVGFRNANVGFYASQKGLYYTTDGGSNWNNIFTPFDGDYQHNKFSSLSVTENIVYAAGYYGALYKIDNLFQIYNCNSSIDNLVEDFKTIFFNDENLGFAGSTSGKIFKTTDGGSNWSGKVVNLEHEISRIQFCDQDVGYLISKKTSYDESNIYKTTNSGENWNSILAENSLQDLEFINSQNGIAITYSGGSDFLATTNGGATWSKKSTNSDINDICIISETEICAVGRLGRIYISSNFGQTWNSGSSPINNDLYKVAYYDGALFAVGNHYVIKSMDKGNNWQIIYTGTSSDIFKDLFFVDRNYIWIVGGSSANNNDFELILKSTDRGNEWERIITTNSQKYEACFFLDLNNGFLVGENTTIMKYTDNKNIPLSPSGLQADPSGNSILLNWTQSSNTIGYKIFRSDYYSGKYNLVYEGDANLFMDTDLLWDSDYFYRVQSFNSTGNSSLSQEVKCRTESVNLTPPQLLYPENNAFNLPAEITFEWTNCDNAKCYNLQLTWDNSFAYIQYDLDNITNNEITISDLQKGFEFYWRVRSINDNLSSSWSEVRKFQIIPELPSKVELYEPPNGATEQPLTLLLDWVPTTADYYHLQVADHSSFTSNIVELDDINSSSKWLEGLQNNKTYFWRVRGKNAAGYGEWSETWHFTTETTTSSGNLSLIPEKFILTQNFPNPFNLSTYIYFELPKDSFVEVNIFNYLGVKKENIIKDYLLAGKYKYRWEATGLSSGVYFINLKCNEYESTVKAILLK